MKKFVVIQIFLGFFMFCVKDMMGQQLANRSIDLTIGESFNTSGDIWGLGFASEFSTYFKKKMSWSIGIGGTIHDNCWPIYFTDSFGRVNDISIRNTIAGAQIFGDIGYSLVRKIKHEIQFRLGVLARYQSSSVPSVTNVLYPAGTGLPFPVYVFQQEDKQRTFAIGGKVKLLYDYNITSKIFVGINSALQVDTNGDNFIDLFFTIGKRF